MSEACTILFQRIISVRNYLVNTCSSQKEQNLSHLRTTPSVKEHPLDLSMKVRNRKDSFNEKLKNSNRISEYRTYHGNHQTEHNKICRNENKDLREKIEKFKSMKGDGLSYEQLSRIVQCLTKQNNNEPSNKTRSENQKYHFRRRWESVYPDFEKRCPICRMAGYNNPKSHKEHRFFKNKTIDLESCSLIRTMTTKSRESLFRRFSICQICASEKWCSSHQETCNYTTRNLFAKCKHERCKFMFFVCGKHRAENNGVLEHQRTVLGKFGLDFNSS